jgi:hypothetical protein
LLRGAPAIVWDTARHSQARTRESMAARAVIRAE